MYSISAFLSKVDSCIR